MNKIFLIPIAIAITIGGCKKSDLKSTSNQNNLFSNTPNSVFVPLYIKNSLNPWDSVGQIHNNELDYLLSLSGNWNSNVYDTLFLQATNFGVLELGQTRISIQNQITADTSYLFPYIESNNGNLDSIVNDLLNDWSAGSNAKSYMRALIDTVLNSNDTINISPLISKIKTIESNINSSTTLTTDEKTCLFQVASTLRYSLHFWSTNTNNPVWPNGGDAPILKKLRKWIKENAKPIVKIAVTDILVWLGVKHDMDGVLTAGLTSISTGI